MDRLRALGRSERRRAATLADGGVLAIVVVDAAQCREVLWGEHGKGLRSQYVPDFFGELYPALQDLKAAFDPFNQLNPGKIATPSSVPAARLTEVDAVTLRGDLDRTIDERVWQHYESAVHCNGNGACYNFDPNDAMCPSWKATRNRIHSPKGRASLIREWLRRQGEAGVDVLNLAGAGRVTGVAQRTWNSLARLVGRKDFSHEVYEAMSGCLACKSCAGQCPIKVNVPDFRSRFLELYHGRYQRPLRDYLIGSLEFTIPYLAHAPGLYNAVMGSKWVSKLLADKVGMVDSPLLSTHDFEAECKRWNVKQASVGALAALSDEQRKRSVILVQDAFTRFFETPLAAQWLAAQQERLQVAGVQLVLAGADAAAAASAGGLSAVVVPAGQCLQVQLLLVLQLI
mgnify:CR=1 FL=1